MPDDLRYYLRQGSIQIGFKWKAVQSGAPAINVYPSADGEGSTSYLTSESAAQEQIGNVFDEAVRDRNNRQSVETSGLFIVKSDYWTDFDSSSSKKCFLFEGASEGKGELSVVFLDENGNQFAEGDSVWLELKNIKKMYQRHDASGNNQWPSVTLESDQNASDETIVFVHSWNQSPDGSSNYAETMFKRLWHRGFKGRYAAIRWNTDWSSTFNNVPLVC